MTSTNALVAKTPGAKFSKEAIELREVGPHEIRIQIAYSGICHSDIHQVRNEWFEGIFPMVPGHEIVGHVIEVGSDVNKFNVGDRAGVGTIVMTCLECEYCLIGQHQHCLKGNVQTYNGRFYDGTPTMGGYAREIVVDQDFSHKVPENLALDEAAPLLCAGITVYNPLKIWGAGPGKRVAVLGFGGLGHLGVKIAVAMGAEVTVLGHSMSKRADAIEFGAVDYRSTAEESTYEDLSNKFHMILNTTSADLEVDKLLGLLRADGSLVNVGLPGKSQSFDPFSLINWRKSIAGSNTGGMPDVQEMLDFCGKHNIGATIELVDASDSATVDKAWDRVVDSDIRYRFVIDASTI